MIKDYSAIVLAAVQVDTEERLQDFVEVMAEHAKAGSPKLTGHNARSISSLQLGKLLWAVRTESGYGGYLDLGTAKMAARPYMRPAFDAARREVLKR